LLRRWLRLGFFDNCLILPKLFPDGHLV
jgi:hypothetical protein